MGNCFKSQLKEAAQNSNLPHLGEITLEISALESIGDVQKQQGLSVRNTEPFTVYVEDPEDPNQYFALSPEDLSVPANRKKTYNFSSGNTNAIYFNNANFKVYISNKYTVNFFTTPSASGYPSVIILNVDDLEYSHIESISFRYVKLKGNLKSLGNITEAISIVLSGCSGLNGTVEGFVESAVAAGRVSANPFPFRAITTAGCNFGNRNNLGEQLIEWDYSSGRNKIVLYCGANNVTAETALTVYEQGATVEEITAWQAAGKTVTDVVSGTVYPPY